MNGSTSPLMKVAPAFDRVVSATKTCNADLMELLKTNPSTHGKRYEDRAALAVTSALEISRLYAEMAVVLAEYRAMVATVNGYGQ